MRDGVIMFKGNDRLMRLMRLMRLVAGLMPVVLLLSGCTLLGPTAGDLLGPPKWQFEVAACAAQVTILDYQEVYEDWERKQLNVAYVGPAHDDPMSLVQAVGMQLERAEGGYGFGYVDIARGSIKTEDFRCIFVLKQLDIGVPAPGHLQLDWETTAAISEGEKEVLVLSFIEYHD